MTFTTTPPTKPGFYVVRDVDAKHEILADVYETVNGQLWAFVSGAYRDLEYFKNYEWCRLVPAEEAEKERDQPKATVEVLREALQEILMRTHPASSFQFSTSVISSLCEKALQSLPPTNLVQRSVLEKCVELLLMFERGMPASTKDRAEIMKEAKAELERTRE